MIARPPAPPMPKGCFDSGVKGVSLAAMTSGRPFWKQPRGMVLLGVGGAVLLATGWLALSRFGAGPSASDAFDPRPRVDENALIAAHAERPNQAAAAPTQAENAVQASADNKPDEADPGTTSEQDGLTTDDVIAEAEEALDAVEQEVGELADEIDGDKDRGDKE